MILSEYANNEVDVQKVIKMAIIHDIVEIYTSDTFIYDEKGKESQTERERIASEKIFGLLPEDQKIFYVELWNKFENNSTNESKFARSIDRIMPLLLNMKSNSIGWKENKIGYSQVYEISGRLAGGFSTLWHYINEKLEENKDRGVFYNSELQ